MTLIKLKIPCAALALGIAACSPQDSATPDLVEPTLPVSANNVTTSLASASSTREAIDQYCVVCHNQQLATADIRLDHIDLADITEHAEVLEKVVVKLRTGTMPPSEMPQPVAEERRAIISWLQSSLDEVAAANPNPGHTETLRRLNRTEYQNAITDLLSLNIDARSLLPPDESGYGFDNVNVGDLPPVLLDRYISAAQKISRLAVGGALTSLQSEVISVPPDLTQERHIPGLPIGTRGGVSVSYTFPQDGEYDIQIRLARNRTGDIGGLRNADPQSLELLLDREIVDSFMVIRPDHADHSEVDKNFISRVSVAAGPHDLGVTFPKLSAALVESERQPLQSRYNEIRHPRLTPAVYQVTVTGPFSAQGAGNTPSRRRLFTCQPERSSEEEACASQIISKLTRRAYRRPITEIDIARPMTFFRQARIESNFDDAIGSALGAVLMNPQFLFRVETAPESLVPGSAYRINDIELASRLSFFLWSSLPDDELMSAAEQGILSRQEELEKQVRRMLTDPRSQNLATNFAGQWLQLRNLVEFVPNPRLYPDFDDNLRQAFRKETELFLDSVLREGRSVLELLDADYTFLNERLAKHYGIAGVYGSRFRRVELGANSERGGLLRQGSVLAVTSFANRTSPVLRGVWVLGNIYGSPPPPAPPNVPALDEAAVASSLPMRERLAAHRNNPVCASCHTTIDPVGFSLENFDAVGRWREYIGDNPVDVAGGLPGMAEFSGVAGLESGLLSRPELFADTVTKKLMTFALGRGVEYYDAPAIRKIVREAEPDGYRFSSLIMGIVKSMPFQMRTAL